MTSQKWISRLAMPALIAGMLLPLYGQNRVSDNDLERFIKNLHEDAKAFRPVFENGLKKSSIRKTSQEKDAKITAERFEKQTDSFAENFKRTHKGDADLQLVVSTAQQIDAVVHDNRLGPETVARWRKVKMDMDQITNAFNAPPAFGPAAPPPLAESRVGVSPYAVDLSAPGPGCGRGAF